MPGAGCNRGRPGASARASRSLDTGGPAARRSCDDGRTHAQLRIRRRTPHIPAPVRTAGSSGGRAGARHRYGGRRRAGRRRRLRRRDGRPWRPPSRPTRGTAAPTRMSTWPRPPAPWPTGASRWGGTTTPRTSRGASSKSRTERHGRRRKPPNRPIMALGATRACGSAHATAGTTSRAVPCRARPRASAWPWAGTRIRAGTCSRWWKPGPTGRGGRHRARCPRTRPVMRGRTSPMPTSSR